MEFSCFISRALSNPKKYKYHDLFLGGRMSKKLRAFGFMLFFLALAAAPLLAQEQQAAPALTDQRASLFKLSLIVGGAVIAIASAVGALCQAKAISAACEGISRNPASGPLIRFLLIFGLVLIETLVIYALLITIIILMVQWGKYI
jgi:F-type H+-transporting ATPase subunit c